MKSLDHQQLQLFDIPSQPLGKTIHDPYWDEIVQSDIVDSVIEKQHHDFAGNEALFGVANQNVSEQDACVRAQLSSIAYPYKSVGAQVVADTKKSAPEHDAKLYNRDTDEISTHWIEKYWVERVGNKYWYYRYCWMEGRKKNRVYIGSVRSPKAQLKKQAVEEAIALELSPQEIKQLIRGWKYE